MERFTDVAEANTRFIAPTPVAAAVPTVFPAASVPAGTPIILTPRVPRLSSVTPSLPSATVLTGQPPSAGSAADAAAMATGSVIYPVDAYVQQMLEYSTALQRGASGCSQFTVITLHRVRKKRGHVIFDYKSRISWWIFIIFIPLETGTDTPQSYLIYLLDDVITV